jgi:two-component system, NtrC family, sensor kinase
VKGREVWFSASLSPSSNDSVVWVARDISERKQAEASKTALTHGLEQSERCLSQIVASVCESIIVQEQQNHQVLFVNAAATALFDRTYEELIGESLGLPLISGELTEVDIIHPSGKLIVAEMRTVDIVWENQAAYLITLRDVTKRKRAEEELRQSEERWRLVLQGSQDGIWDKNLKTNEVFRSARWKEILGYESHEILNNYNNYEQWVARIHPDDVERAMQAREDYLARKIPSYAVEYRLQCKDDSYKWVLMRAQAVWDESGSPVRLVGAMTDINERKIAEKRLRLLERAIAASNNGIIISDAQAPNNPVIYANSGFERITGYTKEEIIGKNCRFLHGTDTAQPALKELKRSIAESRETQVVLRNYRKDGTLFWNEFCLTPVRDATGQLTHFIGIQIDISDRKIAEEALRKSEVREREKAQTLERVVGELKRTQAQLIQAEKMSSLGQMVAGIAHEINNPTSFIYGNIAPATEYAQNLLHMIELYRQYYPKPVEEITEQLELIELDFIVEDFPKLLASMQEGAQRIKQIVLSLRNFSRLDESERKRVEIHEGIDNTLLILKHRLKQQPKRPEIRVISEYGQLPKIECYPGQLNQVFMNIISNAIDALDEAIEKQTDLEATIRICTEVIKGESRSSHSDDQSASRVLIRIADNSPSSIKAELLPKIFDPFFTTKPVGSGTGLGLSISYQIVVDRHRGQLRCYSTPGVGTEFAIELPIA